MSVQKMEAELVSLRAAGRRIKELEAMCNGLYGAALTHQFGCAIPTSECEVCSAAQKWQAMKDGK